MSVISDCRLQLLAQDPTAAARKIWFYVAIAATGISGLVLLITLLSVRRIRIAIATIKIASQVRC